MSRFVEESAGSRLSFNLSGSVDVASLCTFANQEANGDVCFVHSNTRRRRSLEASARQ